MPNHYNLPLKERLKRGSRRRATTGCLIWQGTVTSQGQGRIWWKGRYASVGRLAYELAKGRLPKGTMALRRCTASLCIEPRHLFAGSQPALSEKIRRKRGEQHPNHKLTAAMVRRIKAWKGSHLEAANHFGVSRKTIGLIRQGKAWAHIAGR